MAFRLGTGLVLAFALATSVYRAATQAITHDEALTYNTFLTGSWSAITENYFPNNHVLFTILAKASVTAFGASELTLRLPTLLSAALFLYLVFRIGGRCWGSGVLRLAGTAALVLSPFVLDYLSAARGYGLMLAMLVWSVDLAHRALTGARSPRALLLLSGIAAGLAVGANLPAAFPVAALAAVVPILFATRAGSGRAAATAVILHGIPAACVGGGICLIAMWRGFDRGQLFFGSADLGSMLRSLARPLMNRDLTQADGVSWMAETWATHLASQVLIPLFCALIVAFVAGLAWKLLRGARFEALGADGAMILLCGSTLIVAFGALVAAHVAQGILYPSGRTGIWLVVLGLITVVTIFARLGRGARAAVVASRIGCALLGLMALYFVTQLNTTHYTEWAYDRHSRELYYGLERHAAARGGRPVRVLSVPFLYEPAMNFYRTVRRAPWLQPVQRDLTLDVDVDYVLLHPSLRDRPEVQERLVLVEREPKSGVLIMSPKPKAGSRTTSREAPR